MTVEVETTQQQDSGGMVLVTGRRPWNLFLDMVEQESQGKWRKRRRKKKKAESYKGTRQKKDKLTTSLRTENIVSESKEPRTRKGENGG